MESEGRRSNPDFTETANGDIDHKAWRGMRCPVALRTIDITHSKSDVGRKIQTNSHDLPVPDRDSLGRYLYALPGGGRATL